MPLLTACFRGEQAVSCIITNGNGEAIVSETINASVNEAQVYDALRQCYDPEIPVNVVELGLIYDVKIIDDWVGVKMTLTTPGCGMSGMIAQDVRNRVLGLPGVKEADVRIVWEPAWTPERMTPEARKKLGLKG
ncbi:MAG: metal-sulfur cluster assembly factor [Ignavibacteriae bacterium]|nr:metal-sulfur cluster assembly factor [Ignavibacteriota bacterium]